MAVLVPIAGIIPFAAQEQDKAGDLEPKWIEGTENSLSKSGTAALRQIAPSVN